MSEDKISAARVESEGLESGPDALSTKRYWDTRYAQLDHRGGRSMRGRLKALEKRLRRYPMLEYLRGYDDYQLWEVIYKEYMPRGDRLRVLEIGSAPGAYLVRLHRAFGVVPFGVEYSDDGAQANRQKFFANDLDPNNVIHADFLSDAFQKAFRERFDVVVSRGFIEHFSDVQEVVDKHLRVLTPGGLLFVSVPNLRGVNYVLSWVFQRRLLPMHNLAIMEKEQFATLFELENVKPLFCGYYGVFNFGLFEAARYSPARPLLRLCKLFQLPLNAVFRVLFGGQPPEARYTSPYLLFVGRKASGMS